MAEPVLCRENELRDWLIVRVSRELQIDEAEIDVNARIMTLGVDSLSLIGLAGELAEMTNRDLHAELLWKHDTIAALARHLASDNSMPQTADSISDSLLPDLTERTSLRILRWGVRHNPAIAVGSMVIADFLEQRLPGGVAVGWFQLDSFYRGAGHVRSVRQLAADFADELTAQFPSGPLTLVGYSYSGIVAFDLACQLVDRDRQVRLLLLEPARFDRGPLQETSFKRLRRHLREIRQRTWNERYRYLRSKLQSLYDRAHVNLFRQRLVARKLAGAHVSSRFNWRLAEPGLMASLCGYRPPELDGSVVIAARPDWFNQNAATWERHITKTLVTLPLIGVPDHQAVQMEAAASTWMPIVRDWHANEVGDCG